MIIRRDNTTYDRNGKANNEINGLRHRATLLLAAIPNRRDGGGLPK